MHAMSKRLSSYQICRRMDHQNPDNHPIPFGKSFHIFFLYRNVKDDRDVVNCIRTQLEQVGYVCCCHQGSFVPGLLISENIRQCLKSSTTIGILLSKNFLNSRWCMEELRQSIHYQIKNMYSQPFIIPMILDLDEGEIPYELEMYTYVDAQEFSVVSKIQLAINHAILNHKDDTTIAVQMLQTLSPVTQINLSHSLDITSEEILLGPMATDFEFLKKIFGLKCRLKITFCDHCTVFEVYLTLNCGKYIVSRNEKLHNLIMQTWEYCCNNLEICGDVSADNFFRNDTNIVTFYIEILHEKLEVILIGQKPFLLDSSYVMNYSLLVVEDGDGKEHCTKSEGFLFTAEGKQFYCSAPISGFLP